MNKPSLPPLSPLVQNFFCQRLQAQQQVSPHTVASYRDTLRLLLAFLERQRGHSPSQQTLGDWNGPTILDFLDHLETERGVAKLAPATFVWRPCAPLCAMSRGRRPKRWP